MIYLKARHHMRLYVRRVAQDASKLTFPFSQRLPPRTQLHLQLALVSPWMSIFNDYDFDHAAQFTILIKSS